MNLEPLVDHFNAYQRFTPRTAQYPAALALPYLGLGLCDEAVELDVAVSRAMSEVGTKGNYASAILDELGDNLWYLAQLLLQKEVELGEIYRIAIAAPEDRDFDATLHSQTTYIIHRAGALAGKIKKELRDGKDCRGAMSEIAANILLAGEAIARGLGTTLVDVANRNREKLEDRLARDVIKGSGDNR
jgi:NTP pyrophosphatase (non-canonical NTP hydrolase)